MATQHSTIPPEVQLALGRLFLMGSRPEQPGDTEAYFACRAIIMASAEDRPVIHSHSFARDYGRGAAGQWN